jgi:nucleoside-diphosphate-sugar epimerase
MRYHLLTGATGLLGNYFLKDAAALKIPLAVVVRRSRAESARQRIETGLARWEQLIQTPLPRPVILEGNLTAPHLGLNTEQVAWVAENCSAVIHNAASLNFTAKDLESEPYLSNVQGTKNVLELCRTTGIRTFHHVSTAYICGLRNGTVYESERNVGQPPGNDYEASKIQAEEMVANAEFLDHKTFLRPGIIIGDSVTGYTSTFHGFYVPLKICHGLMNIAQGFPSLAADGILHWFNLTGEETKNFVPVDWVSAVSMRVIANPEYYDRTYHLTPTHSTRVADMAMAIGNTFFHSEGEESEPAEPSGASSNLFRQTFLNQMQVYESYWRDDPVFDRTNTLAITPDLPCPEVDQEMLAVMCRYAVESNFGWPVEPSRIPAVDTSRAAEKLKSPSPNSHTAITPIGLVVTGPGGGDWQLDTANGKILSIREGLSVKCREILRLNSQTLQELIDGTGTFQQALQLGRIVVEAPQAETSLPLEALLLDYVRLLSSPAAQVPGRPRDAAKTGAR